MKLFVAFLFLFGTLNAEIYWHTNYEQAVIASQESSKPLFVLFSADWCGWCRKLNQEILTNPEFENLVADRMIFVKVDGRSDLNQLFGVKGIPSTYLLDAEQVLIGKEFRRNVNAVEFGNSLLIPLDNTQCSFWKSLLDLR